MKRSILILACAAIAPFAFAQTDSTTAKSATTATESALANDPVTGTALTTNTNTSANGTVTTFVHGKTIGLQTSATDPTSYVLGSTVQYVSKAGKEIDASTIKSGSRVHVYFEGTGETKVVNRVVVDE